MDFLVLLLGGAVLGLAGVFVRLAETTAQVGPFGSAFWRMLLATVPLAVWAAWTLRHAAAPSAATAPAIADAEVARHPTSSDPAANVAKPPASAFATRSGDSSPPPSEPPSRAAPLRFRRQPAPPALLAGWTTPALAVFAAAMFALDLVFFHLAVVWTAVGNATLESNFAPVLITLAFWAATGVAPRAAFVAGLAAAVGGAALMIGPNFGHSRALLGDASGLLSAVFYAAYQIGVQQARQRLATAPLMAGVTALSALVLWPFALAEGRLWPSSPIGWLWLLGLALLVQIGGQVVIAYAVRRLHPALSSIGLLVQPAMAVVYAWLLLGEALTAVQIVGAALVLLGIYLARRSL